MENLVGEKIGNWIILEFSHTKIRCKNRYRHYWLAECINCKFHRKMEKHNMACGSKCQHCFGKKQGEAGLLVLMDNYIRNSKNNERIFELNKNDFIALTSSPCHYCLTPPEKICRGDKKSKSHWGDYYYNGIDRVDNNIGYTLDNCVSCCVICNRAKNNLNYKDFVAYINRIKLNDRKIK